MSNKGYSMRVNCPKCSTENGSNAKFCKACGEKLVPPVVVPTAAPPTSVFCPACGMANTPNAKFCKSCGKSIVEAPAPLVAPVSVAPPPRPQATVVDPVSEPKAEAVVAPPLSSPVKPQQATTPTAQQALVAGEPKDTNYAVIGGIAAVCLVLLGAGAYFFMGQSAQPSNSPTATASEPLSATAPVVPTPTPVAAMVVPASSPDPAPAPASEPSTTNKATKPENPKQATANKRPQKPVSVLVHEAAPTPIVTSTPAPAPAAAQRQEPAKPVTQPAIPVGPSSPEEACGKRVFIALAMCINEQCDKPQFTNHPQCVKFRQQTKDNQDRMEGR